MRQEPAAWLLLAPACCLAGCVLEASLAGKSCDQAHPCAPGYVCAAGSCVVPITPTAVGGASDDAGEGDDAGDGDDAGGGDDAGRSDDAGAADAGREDDAGSYDAGVGEDAGVVGMDGGIVVGGWLPGYRQRKAVTVAVPGSGVGDDLLAFPLLVATAAVELAATEFGGRVTSQAGDDIEITGADGVTLLPHELVSYEPVRGALVAWVLVPRLSLTGPTPLYLYYGNAGVAAPTERPSEVWAAYSGAWHLEEEGGVRQDSSPQQNHLAESPSAVPATAGMVGRAASFLDASQHRLTIADGAQQGLDVAGPFTISFWANPSTAQSGWRNVVCKWATASDVAAAGNSYYVAFQHESAQVRVKLVVEDGGGSTILYGNTQLDLGEAHHIAAVYDGAALRVYVDGMADGFTARAAGARDSATGFDLGNKASSPAYGHEGMLDEVRVAPLVRSPQWLMVEVLNQMLPEAMVSLGQQEQLP